ncbi:MAG: hypothetical protein NT141_02945 [candidate division WWE3 bacterium]|nr:hypothetical protein [candidate division WWE3 bacterium]
MKLDDFVAGALSDINKGLSDASKVTGKSSYIEISSPNNGVHFDVAVTTANSTEQSADGKIGIGVIQVVGLGVNATVKNNDASSVVSRIQFTVVVPPDSN